MTGSSTSSGSIPTVVLHPITKKLARNNHMTWHAQVLAALRGAHLEGLVTGGKKAPPAEIKEKDGDKEILVPNPEYEDWLASDQQVLSFIFAYVTKEILVRVAATKTAYDAWKILEQQLTSQTRARVVNVQMALATTHKGICW
jgi:hypothetical protein